MTTDEIRAAITASPALLELARAGNTQAIADALSEGRQTLVPTEIGAGTILAALGGAGMSGGVFLDTITQVAEQDRDLFWTMDLIRQGRLRIDMPATRAGLERLGQAVPSLAPAVAVLLTLGYAPDPVSEFEVRCAIYADDGTLKV